VHEQKRFVIAAAVAVVGLTGDASAQKDAAEKAREGGIEHWIEYYKGEQRKPAPVPAQPASATVDGRSPPAGRTAAEPAAGQEVLRK
jgi:hypothetical protein